MSLNSASVSVVTTFPAGFFLENIASLPDGTLLVTVANRKALYALPPAADPAQPRQPILLHQFDDDAWAFGITVPPQNPRLAYILTSDFTSQGSCMHHLSVLDVCNVASACHPRRLMQFPAGAKGLNGLVALSETVFLAADSFAGCIWRVDVELDEDGTPAGAQAKVWLADPTFDGKLILPDFQPGVNGLKFSTKTNMLCFSSTQQRLFGTIPVNPETLMPAGPVHILLKGPQGDDLIIDDDYVEGPVAYLTTHRDNSIIRIPVLSQQERESRIERKAQAVLQGTRENPLVLGPTSGVWESGSEGRVAYFNCDGGLKNPLQGEIPRFARVLRVEF